MSLVRMVPSHECLETAWRSVVAGVGKQTLEFRARFDRGRERISRIELQCALKPAAQCGRQWLLLAARFRGHRRCHDLANSPRILVVSQRASENERERGDAELRNVGEVVE